MGLIRECVTGVPPFAAWGEWTHGGCVTHRTVCVQLRGDYGHKGFRRVWGRLPGVGRVLCEELFTWDEEG